MDFLDQLEAMQEKDPFPERPWPAAEAMSSLSAVEVHGLPVLIGSLPFPVPQEAFAALWALHPSEYPTIMMYASPTLLPRWQQAYVRDYQFSGQVSSALPLPPELEPFLGWAQRIEPRVNGLLLNWYDADKAHYIGAHRDSTVGLVDGTPIITASLGATRNFRLRPFKRPGSPFDIDVRDGDVVIIPWSTNLALSHEVPHKARFTGRRISVTARAFT